MRFCKRSKYRAVKTTVDGETFDSKKEARRWGDLQRLKLDGQITDLTRDKKKCTFELHGISGDVVCKYIADAIYRENLKNVAEDTKSEITRKNPVYRLKKKLFNSEYGQLWQHREV